MKTYGMPVRIHCFCFLGQEVYRYTICLVAGEQKRLAREPIAFEKNIFFSITLVTFFLQYIYI